MFTGSCVSICVLRVLEGAYVGTRRSAGDAGGCQVVGSGRRLFFRGTHKVRDDLQLSHFVG